MRMATSREPTDSKEKLASDFKDLVKDAEALFRTTGDYAGEGFAQARSKFEQRLNRLKEQFPETPYFAMRKYRQAAATTDRYVRDNPWQIIGAVAAVSILIGFLTARR
jgi:ElaB/YqjD/DUF883 family membrane-anchored ribosome-binding protein